jgi:hypothetical protein
MGWRDLVKACLGCTAILAWILLFAAGLLLNSRTYRERLGAPVAAMADVAGAAAPPDGTAPSISHPPPSGGLDWTAFGATILIYTPLNAALLVMIAGLIGGCASSLTFNRGTDAAPSDTTSTGADDPRLQRAMFLTENPFASMLRSFVVYVGFIAGVYITSNEPFANATADQYARFVGMLSLLGFVVGYDPTKFQDFLNLVPRPGARR